MSNTATASSIRQQILAKLYPLIMKMGSWFGMRASIKMHTQKLPPPVDPYPLPIQLNTGTPLNLQHYRGKKILVVNTASNCGYTAQYAELQELYAGFQEKLAVIGFPSNDFKNQELGSDDEIQQFCQVNYGVQFPMSKKSTVTKGAYQHPVFQWLSDPAKNGWCDQEPEWNFSKYLLDEEGRLTHYFAPGISPADKRLLTAVNG